MIERILTFLKSLFGFVSQPRTQLEKETSFRQKLRNIFKANFTEWLTEEGFESEGSSGAAKLSFGELHFDDLDFHEKPGNLMIYLTLEFRSRKHTLQEKSIGIAKQPEEAMKNALQKWLQDVMPLCKIISSPKDGEYEILKFSTSTEESRFAEWELFTAGPVISAHPHRKEEIEAAGHSLFRHLKPVLERSLRNDLETEHYLSASVSRQADGRFYASVQMDGYDFPEAARLLLNFPLPEAKQFMEIKQLFYLSKRS